MEEVTWMEYLSCPDCIRHRQSSLNDTDYHFKEEHLLPPTPPGEISILVVDDSPHLRALISAYIRKAGYTKTVTAGTGAEGIGEYKKSRPDIVFLDVVMPVMDGIAALKEIKKIDPTAIVVMVTSIASRETVLELKEAGAYSYILKPFEEAKFIEILRKTVAYIGGSERKD